MARTIVETVADKGITTICAHTLWTNPIIDFARYLESIGASALQLVLPNYGDEDAKVKYFEDIARSTRLSLVLRGNLPMPLLSRLMKIDTIVAMKHDAGETYLREVLIHYRNRLNSYAGGSWEWFVMAQPWGATATLDTYTTFAPEVSVRFWKAVDANDPATVRGMIEKYEHPLLRHKFTAAFWRAALEYFGIAARYVRPPERPYSETEMPSVKTFFDELGIYPEK